MAIIGLVIPPVGLVGAVRLGKPHSVWAHLFYKHGQLDKSEQRLPRPIALIRAALRYSP